MRHQMQRIFFCQLTTQPFRRFKPCRVAGAIVVVERRNSGRGNFDLARRRGQFMGHRVGAEAFHHHRRLLRWRHFEQALGPEGFKRRQRDVEQTRALGGFIIEVAQPCSLVTALGKFFFYTEALRQPAENIVIVARFGHRSYHALHGDDMAVAATGADVVALQHGGGGEHDIRQLGVGVPVLLVDDNGFRLRSPRAHQTIQILMVMKRIAARPINQADVGVGAYLAVEIVMAAGVFQHVGDARHGDRRLHAVGALRQHRAGERARVRALDAHRAVGQRKAAAGRADLAENGGECNRHPIRLLAMIAALQRPRHVDHGAAGIHTACKVGDRVRGHIADRGGPRSRLGRAIGFTHDVAAQRFKIRAVTIEERAIVFAVGDDGVRQRQHKGGVGVRPHGNPFRAGC